MDASLRSCIKRHLQSDQILSQLLDSLRTEIQQAIDAKQVLLEGFEHAEENEDRHITKTLLMDEQQLNQAFIKSICSAIDYLDLNMKSKKEILEETMEDEDDDGDED